jgi:hypothetical protein
MSRDLSIITLLRKYHLDTALLVYQLSTYSPIETLVNILILKYGLPPFLATFIIALL